VENRNGFRESIREALRLIGGFGQIKSPLVIKPNICAETDLTGCANVDAEIVESFIKLILEKDPTISIKIVESDSMSKFVKVSFKKFGYYDLEKRMREQGYDVECLDLSEPPLSVFEFDGLYFKDPELHNVLKNPGYFVSIALPKTHSLTLVTGALKNLFGLLPKKDQAFYHPKINEVVVDLNRIIPSDLCIIDARTGMEGVQKGKTRNIGAVIVGKNPVSVDSTMARIMGFNPEKIRHIAWAENYNLGTLNPKIVGETLESLTVKFKEPNNLKTSALID
jgi:uncharacterized protein (DUF362 family)